MTPNTKICYNNFIASLMGSTGLPLSQIQTITEWLHNRKNQFENESDAKDEKLGFEFWLSKKYRS